MPGKWWIGRKLRWVEQFTICHSISEEVLPNKEIKSNIEAETYKKKLQYKQEVINRHNKVYDKP